MKLVFTFYLFILSIYTFADNKTPQKIFKAPKSTIVNDKSFIPNRHFTGEADGKTIGIDGKPLADHRIYKNDSFYFLERVEIGLKNILSKTDYKKISDIINICKQKKKEIAERYIANYKDTWGQSYKKEKFYKLAYIIGKLNRAIFDYDFAEGNMNYTERLRVKDRIDLNNPPNETGKKYRDMMKKSIVTMYRARKAILKKYPKYYITGAKIQIAEIKKKQAAIKYAKIRNNDTQMFMRSSLKGKLIKQGFEWALQKKVLMKAKPMLLEKGEKVQVLLVKNIKITQGSKKMNLKVCRIKITSSKIKQYNAAVLSKITLMGWVIASDLKQIKK